MARRPFGGTPADVVEDRYGNARSAVSVTFWTAATGGSQVTDIQQADGSATSPAGTIITGSDGVVSFLGPADGTAALWADAGSTRVLMLATDDDSRLDTLEALTTSQTSNLAGLLLALARDPNLIVSGVVTYNANHAATSAPVVWPDGASGTYTATTVSSSFPGLVDAYTVTHVLGGVTTTYTQPLVTRDSSGAVTTRPAITVA